MIIAHYKKTPLAMAPDELSHCINKYTNHSSYINEKFDTSDIIQYHNKYFKYIDLFKMNIKKEYILKKPSFILYHSFPEITDNYNEIVLINGLIVSIRKFFFKKSSTLLLNRKEYTFLNNFLPIKKDKINQMVINQYQATLDEYKNYKLSRNLIDYNQKVYNLHFLKNKKIKIGYSPSVTKKSYRSKWETKGYNRTFEIIQKVSKLTNVEYDIIINTSLEECLKRKSMCNIIIDECVTSSYHRSALEGLALGKMTICSLGDKVKKIIKETSGSKTIPFENIWIESLESELIKIIALGSDFINNKGLENRKWMEKYWNPIDITNEYIKYYKQNIQL